MDTYRSKRVQRIRESDIEPAGNYQRKAENQYGETYRSDRVTSLLATMEPETTVSVPEATVSAAAKKEKTVLSPGGTFLGGMSYRGTKLREKTDAEKAEEARQQAEYLKEYQRLLSIDTEALSKEVDAAKRDNSRPKYQVNALSGYDSTRKTDEQKMYASKLSDLNKAKTIQYEAKGAEALGKLSASDGAAVETLATERQDSAARQAAWQTLQQSGYTDDEISQLINYQRNIPKRQKNAELYSEIQDAAAAYAETDPGLATLASVPANLMSGIGTADAAMSRLSDPNSPTDYKSAAMLPYAFSSTARGTVSENLERKHGKAASFLYGVGTSIADSAATAGLALVGVPAGLASATLGGAAATDAMVQAKERGLSDDEAIMNGVAAGVFETLFEKVSLDSLITMNAPTGSFKQKVAGTLKNALKQAGIEGSEELATSAANLFFDHVAHGQMSDAQQRIYAYMAQGMDYTDAKNEVEYEILLSMAEDFAAGALSGGLMGGGGSAVQALSTPTEARQKSREKAHIKGEYKASETGKTTYKGKEVSIDGVDAEGNVVLSSGESVKGNEVEYADRKTAEVYEGLNGSETIPTAARGAIARAYEGKQESDEFVHGMEEAYRAGAYGIPMEDMTRNGFNAELTDTQKKLAYDLGAGMRKEQSEQKQGGGLVNNEYSRKLKKGSATFFDRLGKDLGVQIEFVDTVRGGSANGQYVGSKKLIQIAADSNNALEFVAAHEVTHRMQELAPKEYLAYRESAMAYMSQTYGKEGAESLVAQYRLDAESVGVKLSQEETMDEIAADFTKAMMEDGKLFEDFARENHKEARTLLDSLKAFIERVKALFKGESAQDRAAQDAYGTDMATLEKCAALWQNAYDAAKDAKNTASESKSEGRYQLKSAPELEQEVRELRRERKALENRSRVLAERVEKWKGELKRTETPRLREGDIKNFSKGIIDEYDSDVKYSDIEEDMKALGKALMEKDVSMNDLRPHARAAAEKIIDGVLVQSESGAELLAIRDHLKSTTLRYTDNGDIADFKEWRKANRKMLKVSESDGVPVDVVYAELTDMFGEGYFPSSIIHPGDQLQRMSKVLEDVGRIYENPFDGYRDVAVTELSNILIDGVMSADVRQAAPTFADRKALELQEAKAKLTQTMNKRLESRDRKIARMRQKYQEQTEAGREKRKTTELRSKITRHSADLSRKLLRPTDKQHIPENLRQSVAALLNSINMESSEGKETKRTQTAIELKQAYKDVLNSGDTFVIDPDLLGEDGAGLLDTIQTYGDKPIADMTNEELTVVWKAIRAIEKSVTTYNKLLMQQRYKGISEQAEAFRSAAATRRRVNRKFSLDLADPYTFFAAYGEGGMALYRELRDAQDQQNAHLKNVQAEVDKFSDKKVFKDRNERHTFTTENGQRLTLTTGQVMNLYNLINRGKQATNHLMVGGIVQPEIKRNGKQKPINRGTENIRLTTADMKAITDVLTDKQKAVAEGFQKVASGRLAKWGNDASMLVYGYNKFTEKNYWPIRSAKEGTVQNSEKGADISREIKNMGSAKALTPNASNPLDIGDVYEVFAQNASDMIQYSTLLAPMEDANRLFNYRYRNAQGALTGKNMKNVLTDVYGDAAQKYWRNLMRDVQNGLKVEGTDTTRMVEKLVGGTKAASVGFNLRVVMQQPTAYVRAAAVISPEDMAKGIAAGATKGDGWDKARKYAPIASIKDTSGFDQSSRYAIAQNIYPGRDGIGGALDKLNEASGYLAGKADAVTWGKIWNACEWATVREGGYERGSNEFYERTAKIFTDVIDQSQVVDGVLQRSQIMRDGNGLTKQATAFMGEPIKTLNMFLRAYDSWRFETDTPKKREAMSKLRRTIGAVLVTDVLNAMVQSIMDAFRDDDKDKNWLERYFTALTGVTGEEDTVKSVLLGSNIWDNIDPIGRVPYAKDVKSIMQGYSVTRMDADAVSDFINAAQRFIKASNDEGQKTTLYATKQLLTTASKMFGVSVANVGRDVWAIARSVAQETGNVRVMYEMEKAIWRVAPDAKNNSRYYALLFKAAESDKETYEYIYNDLISKGYSADQIKNGMKSAIKDSDKSETDMKKMLQDVGFEAEDAADVVKEWEFESTYGYSYRNRNEAYAAGAITKSQLVDAIVDIGGKTRKEAEFEATYGYGYSSRKEAFLDGAITKNQLVNAIMDIDEKSREDAEAMVEAYEWEKEGILDGGSAYITKAYKAYGEPNEIDLEAFVDFYQKASKMRAEDLDGDGKVDNGSKKAKVLALIDGMPLTHQQKDALYFQQGYAESTLYEAPWH